MDIEVIIERIAKAKKTPNFDEQDTVERLIVPVIQLSGWDIDSIDPFYLRRKKADTRSYRQRFDLELHIPGYEKPKFVFECKAIYENIQLIGKGASNNTNDASDFVRQLRNYCLDGKHLFEQNWSVPIFTNGCGWVIFTSMFTETGRKNENISEDNFNDFVRYNSSVGDKCFSGVIEILKYSNAEATRGH
ncbi:MAG: hypothetical protein ABIF87_13625 [Pseudomonadota bacterium]